MARTPAQIDDDHLRLLLAPGVGPVTCRRLLAQFGSAAAAVGASSRELAALPGIGRRSAEAIRRALAATDPTAQRRAMERAGAGIILLGDDDYPPLLAAIDDAPVALWVRGDGGTGADATVAVVGSRHCSAWGREQAGRFAGLLATCEIVVVSGGAAGIDGAAHRGALRAGGRTVVVAGCGVDRAYPPGHAPLFEEIVAAGGAILSEHPCGTEPRPAHFPRRNRIISGLSLAVIVIEAGRRSGALITARLAVEDHGRDVFVVPGRADAATARGGLEAARDGWARLAIEPRDVLEHLEGAGNLVRGAREQAGRGETVEVAQPVRRPAARRILRALADAGGSMPFDDLVAAACLSSGAALAELTLLEIRGLIVRGGDSVTLRSR